MQQIVCRRPEVWVGRWNKIISKQYNGSGVPRRHPMILQEYLVCKTRLMSSFVAKGGPPVAVCMAVGARSTFLQQHQHKKIIEYHSYINT